jgi:hypothetical protein
MLPTPHTSYRLVELHHHHLRAEFHRMRQGEKSPTRATGKTAGAWDHFRHWTVHWRSSVRWPRPWRWSSP